MKNVPQKLTQSSQILAQTLQEGDMGVYGIAVLAFFSCGISVILIFNVRYCAIILLCGMRFFIILADGIR